MLKTIMIFLALIIAGSLIYQAGKWSAKQPPENLAAIDASAASQMTGTKSPQLSAAMTIEPAATTSEAASTLPVKGPVEDRQTSATPDLVQLIQVEAGGLTLNLTENVLTSTPEQLQQAMWQLEQHATSADTYHRQQNLQQQLSDYELGTLVQLNCSDTLCVAMMHYETQQGRQAALPLLASLAKAESTKATFISKEHAKEHYSFVMFHGWSE